MAEHETNIIDRINDACVGHPYALIPWPHRLLHDARAEIERLRGIITRMHAEEARLSQGLCAISEAPENAPASVLRSIAHDIALNCIPPDVARFQIERRTGMKVGEQ